MRRCVALLALLAPLVLAACGADETPTTSSSTTTSTPAQSSTTTSTSAPVDRVLVSFADPDAVVGWTNVDDTVMGGVSDSVTRWSAGNLVFSGTMSLDNNGGFVSTVGPVDRSIGTRAAGVRTIVVDATDDDSRTYVLLLRAGRDGVDRWIARFTPPTSDNCCAVELPLDEFRPVDRFLRSTTPSMPLDPSTIVQMGIYLTDGQQGRFVLRVASIDANP